MIFKDHFSKQSDIYLKYRPHYPEGLYAYLSSLCKHHELAWDCGTGNGQAATGIAGYFKRVIATDPSEQQIKNAAPCKNVEYSVSSAENSMLINESVDLITIANALHWFNLDDFFKEAKRILKPGGILAAWCYGNPASSTKIDSLINTFHDGIIGEYWLPENRLVEKKYSTISFPFKEIKNPGFKIERSMYFDDLVGLLNTWSAVQRYKDKNGKTPLIDFEKELSSFWKDKSAPKTFTWDLTIKICMK